MLLELLEKRKNNEQLTEEELKTLAEYDNLMNETTKSYVDKVATLENEVKSKSELEKKIEELNSQSKLTLEELTKVKSEKEDLEKQVQNAVDIEEVKTNLRKALEEKQALELEREREKQAKKIKEKENELSSKIQELENKLKEQASLNELNGFRQEVMQEKIKRPYLVKQLDKILSELETKGVSQSRMIMNFLLESINHDEELGIFNRKAEAGQSILEKKELETKQEVDPFQEFLKRHPRLK